MYIDKRITYNTYNIYHMKSRWANIYLKNILVIDIKKTVAIITISLCFREILVDHLPVWTKLLVNLLLTVRRFKFKQPIIGLDTNKKETYLDLHMYL